VTRQRTERLATIILTAVAASVVLPIIGVLAFLIVRGLPGLTPRFVLGAPTAGLTGGGVGPALLGTVLLTIGTAFTSVPLAVAAAIYLAEYAPDNLLTALVRLAIVNLAGIPSIVYGLFGLAVFVLFLGAGTSILAGSLTLGLLTLPVVISTSEEALVAVPQEFRVTSLSLGATKWQTVRHQVLPHALPGILTGVILGLGRAAGETAPILFTVAAAYLPGIPHSVLDQTMALPYHLYVIATQIPGVSTDFQYATALLLLLLVLAMTVVASTIRSVVRRRREW
jgi:phosphate transport system permease protein